MIVRCQSTCPHNDQCRLEAGHEPISGHSHLGCVCNEPNRNIRPEWPVYFMGMAWLASLRSTCDRLHVGAVLVRDNHVLATGYNGAPSGWQSCDEAGHELRNIDGRESCVRTIHAEENAIIQCAIYGINTVRATLYTTASPCYDCAKRVAQAGIGAVKYALAYDSARNGSVNVAKLLMESGVRMDHQPA